MSASASSSRPLTHDKSRLASIPLRNVSATLKPRNKVSSQEMTPNQRESVLFDMAAISAGLSSEFIALELGVSKSLVSKWRSPEYDELPNLGHVAKLGEDFERILAKVRSRARGWGRLALIDLVSAVEDAVAEVG